MTVKLKNGTRLSVAVGVSSMVLLPPAYLATCWLLGYLGHHVPHWFASTLLLLQVFSVSFVFETVRSDKTRKIIKGAVDLSLTVWGSFGILSYKPFVTMSGIDALRVLARLPHWTMPVVFVGVSTSIALKGAVVLLDLCRDITALTAERKASAR